MLALTTLITSLLWLASPHSLTPLEKPIDLSDPVVHHA
jgi:hypothetical protein